MAIKGLGYLKTTWAFEERPVTSAKLNGWDDRIEAALELLHLIVSDQAGGVDGVIRRSDDALQAGVIAPTSLSTIVQPGFALINRGIYRLASATPTADVTPPVTHPRIDLVQARLDTWDITVKEGTEDPSPVAPGPDANALPLAHLYLRPGMTSIEAADDATNGYIIDVRPFI